MTRTHAAIWRVARPLLFALDPERAHALTLGALDALAAVGIARHLMPAPVDDPIELMGLRFRNRVGLAAGLDKDGRHLRGLGALGFGFVEVGTVTPMPQPGNPRPRIFRLPEHDALINRMGFNNRGLAAFRAAIERSGFDGVLGLNIGKNATTPLERATDDYLAGLRGVYPLASYVTINVSSPNTAGLRRLQGAEELAAMLCPLVREGDVLAKIHDRRVPLLVKIAPDLDDAQIDAIAATLVAQRVDGVIATNTTIDRTSVAGHHHAAQAGGLSGAPVRAQSTRVVRELRRRLPAGFPIIGVGGIMSAQDAREKIDAGADLIQIYTGLVFRGPSLVADCAGAVAAVGIAERSDPCGGPPVEPKDAGTAATRA